MKSATTWALAALLALGAPALASGGGPGVGELEHVAIENYVQRGKILTLTRGVWVRDMPTVEGKKLKWLAPGAKVTFAEDVGHWARIVWPKGEAYIPRLDFVLRQPAGSK